MNLQFLYVMTVITLVQVHPTGMNGPRSLSLFSLNQDFQFVATVCHPSLCHRFLLLRVRLLEMVAFVIKNPCFCHQMIGIQILNQVTSEFPFMDQKQRRPRSGPMRTKTRSSKFIVAFEVVGTHAQKHPGPARHSVQKCIAKLFSAR